MSARTALTATAVWLTAGCLAVVPTSSAHALSPAEHAHPSARVVSNHCPGSYDVTKSTGIKTRSGARWGTSYLKLRKSTDTKAFCAKVAIARRFHNKQTVVTFSALSFSPSGQQLGELSGQMFGSKLYVATYIGNGFQPGEYVTYKISMTSKGRHAKARTLRVTLP